MGVEGSNEGEIRRRQDHETDARLQAKHGRLATNASSRDRHAVWPVAPPKASSDSIHCTWLARSEKDRGAKEGCIGGVGGGAHGGFGGGVDGTGSGLKGGGGEGSE